MADDLKALARAARGDVTRPWEPVEALIEAVEAHDCPDPERASLLESLDEARAERDSALAAIDSARAETRAATIEECANQCSAKCNEGCESRIDAMGEKPTTS